MEKPKGSGSLDNCQEDKKPRRSGTAKPQIRQPWSKKRRQPGVPYPPAQVPEGMRYSPPPLNPSLASNLPDSTSHQQVSPNPVLQLAATETRQVDISQDNQQAIATVQQQDAETEQKPSTPSLSSQEFPLALIESSSSEQVPTFHQQLPQGYHYYADERFDRRSYWIDEQRNMSPDDLQSISDHMPSSSWESPHDLDDMSIPSQSHFNAPFTESSEQGDSFRSPPTKARSDIGSSPAAFHQVFQTKKPFRSRNRKMQTREQDSDISSIAQTEPDARYSPSVYSPRPEFDHGFRFPQNKSPLPTGITPTVSTGTEYQDYRAWGFYNRPTSAEAKQQTTNIPKNPTGAKSISGAEIIKEHPLVDANKVRDRLADQRKRIQDQFKAQVAKKLEDSKKAIIPIRVANEAYARIDKLGLLTHPALRLGLLHNKPDNRGIHDKFLELIEAVTFEEYSQMQIHIHMSEKLLRDLNIIFWNLRNSKGKIPVPTQSAFDIFGTPMPQPYGQFLYPSSSGSSNEENKDPTRIQQAEFKGARKPGRFSDDEQTRRIQIETGDYSGNLLEKVPAPAYDPTFKVEPAHWLPPEGYENDFPSAARWEEIAIIKTYHQALIVQQHLYLLLAYIGSPFTLDWMKFTTAKEREAMIVKTFSVTIKMPSDDGHFWVDSEWTDLSFEDKHTRRQSTSTATEKIKFKLSDWREVDQDGFPIPFGRDMYKGITIKLGDPNLKAKEAPQRTMAQYSLFCHEIESYILARDPELFLRLMSGCLISPNLEDFPADPSNFSEDYFWKPAMSIKDVEKVHLGSQLEEGLPFMAGLPLGPNIKQRVKADRTFFYSAFCYNLLLCWREYRDEKVWYFGNGTPERYDPNDPPEMLGHPKSSFPKDTKWTEGSEIEKHVDQLQRLCDILNMGVYIERWVPEDDVVDGDSDGARDIFQRKKKIGEDEPDFGRGFIYRGEDL